MKRSPIVERLSEVTIEPSIRQSGIWFSRTYSERRTGTRFRPGPQGAIVHIIDRKRSRVTVVASLADGQKPIHRVNLAATHPRQVYVETLKAMAKILVVHNWRAVEETVDLKGWCTDNCDIAMGPR